MSYGLDWKTQEDRLSPGFLSRLSGKGKENARHLAGDHSVVDSALLDPSKRPSSHFHFRPPSCHWDGPLPRLLASGLSRFAKDTCSSVSPAPGLLFHLYSLCGVCVCCLRLSGP